MDCGICIENFNKSARKRVKCSCEYECCRHCAKQYLLSINEDAHCMNCKIAWDRNFLVNNFEVKFINDEYKKHRENVLMEREMTLMPSTQIYVEKEIRLEELQKRKKEIKKMIEELFQEDRNINIMIMDINSSSNKHTERNEFIRKCPNGDCRGFLTSNLKCGICNIWACGDCREVKGLKRDSEHICNPEILESVKALDKETRTCPKCSYRIYRTEGCSQMYCSPEFGGCGTAFSWKTGDIETKIHNPHYYDFLRKVNNGEIPRNPDDIVCGAYNVHSACSDIVSKYYKRRRPASGIDVIKIVKNITHMKYVDLPRYVSNKSNLDIRIKYLKNKIDKDGLKKLLQRREKENIKLREKHDVLTMFIDCIIEILSRYCDDENKNYEQYKNEITYLRNCVNDCFVDISKIYKCEKVIIKPNFTIKIV